MKISVCGVGACAKNGARALSFKKSEAREVRVFVRHCITRERVEITILRGWFCNSKSMESIREERAAEAKYQARRREEPLEHASRPVKPAAALLLLRTHAPTAALGNFQALASYDESQRTPPLVDASSSTPSSPVRGRGVLCSSRGRPARDRNPSVT